MTALLFLFRFVHPVFVLECSAPGFSRLFAPHRETTSFTANICSSLKLGKPVVSLISLLMQIRRRINDSCSSNHRQFCLKSLTFPPQTIDFPVLNLGRFHHPLLIHANNHASPQPAEAQNRSEESALSETPGLFGVYGPCALGYHYCVGYRPFPFCVAP